MTADKANFNITTFGEEMEFGSTSYLTFLLAPTKTVMNWAGTRERLLDLLQRGFKNGVTTFRGGA